MSVESLDTRDPTWVEDPRLADYRELRDPALVKQSARFVAEGRMVVRTLLEDSPFATRSVLVDETAATALADELDARPGVPVFRVPNGALRDLAGWQFHQGCLAIGERPDPVDVPTLLERANEPPFVVALDAVSNPDNVGAIFRSSAALGAGAVVLSPSCASPLYRKAIRSSMGAALRLPFSHGAPWEASLAALREADHVLIALDPHGDDLEDVLRGLPSGRPRTLVLGAEGAGLGGHSRAVADELVSIPMQGGVDSLNVAAAAAVALYRLAADA